MVVMVKVRWMSRAARVLGSGPLGSGLDGEDDAARARAAENSGLRLCLEVSWSRRGWVLWMLVLMLALVLFVDDEISSRILER